MVVNAIDVIDLRSSEILHHVALSADAAHHPDMLVAATWEMKNRINEYSDREGLRFVIAVVRPASAQPAVTTKPMLASGRVVQKPTPESAQGPE